MCGTVPQGGGTGGSCRNEAQESTAGTPEKYLSALTEQRCQLQPLLENELVSDIYLDQACYRRKDLWEELKADIAKIHAAGKKAYYVFPSVFRKNTLIVCCFLLSIFFCYGKIEKRNDSKQTVGTAGGFLILFLS